MQYILRPFRPDVLHSFMTKYKRFRLDALGGKKRNLR